MKTVVKETLKNRMLKTTWVSFIASYSGCLSPDSDALPSSFCSRSFGLDWGLTNPRRWAKAEAIITRPDGKPTIAPEFDPKSALNINPINDFDDIEAAEFLIWIKVNYPWK